MEDPFSTRDVREQSRTDRCGMLTTAVKKKTYNFNTVQYVQTHGR
jgi:hypothetical protein